MNPEEKSRAKLEELAQCDDKFAVLLKAGVFSLPHPADIFFKVEAQTLKDYLKDFEKNHPDASLEIEDAYSRMFNPLFSATQFYKKHIPMIKILEEEARQKYAGQSAIVDQYPELKPEERGEEITSHLETLRESKEKWGELLERATSEINIYGQFIIETIRIIVKEDEKRRIVLVGYHPMKDEQQRNKILKQTLSPNNRNLYGWEIKLLSEVIIQQHADQYRLRKIWEESPEIRAVAPKQGPLTIFPQPLGVDQVSFKYFYENMCTTKEKVESIKEFGKLIHSYFDHKSNAIALSE